MPEHKIKRDRSSSYSTEKKKRRHQKRSRSKSRSRSTSRKHKHHKSRKDQKRRSQSRSKSREHVHRHKSQRSEERQREQIDQKIRLSMREGTFEKDEEIQKLVQSLPLEKLQTLHEQAMKPSQINQAILVRQLFISGLIQMNEKVINSIMEGYGIIQNIEICKNFAFVKFYKVEDASNACADYHNINIRLHSAQNPNFKMFFADHLKRWNVVSNNIQYEVKQHLIPVVYASIRNDPKIANQEYLISIFSKFGSIRTLLLKQNQSPGPKVYALVQYETLEQALKAREKLANNKEKLGDRRSQVTILLDTMKVTRTYPNVANQLRYQRQNSKRVQQPHISTSITQNNYNSINIEANQFEADTAVFDMLLKIAEAPPVAQQEVDWSGFLTRNKIYRVNVDLKFMTKNKIQLEFILNVSHRADLSDGIRRQSPQAIGKFKASDQSNLQLFNDYIRYFQEKNRAGIIQTQKYLIYLIPPGLNYQYDYEINKNQMLGLFFKN